GLPEFPAGLPKSPAGLPEFPAGLLKSPSGLPEFPAGLPEFPAGLPKSPAGLPESPAGLPKSHSGLPEFPAGLPKSPEFPAGLPKSPEFPAGLPKSPSGLPEFPAGLPKSSFYDDTELKYEQFFDKNKQLNNGNKRVKDEEDEDDDDDDEDWSSKSKNPDHNGDYEVHRTEVFVEGDPLTSDQLTMRLLSNITNINVTLQRSPSSILMEDMDLMQLFFKKGKLNIEKEQLPVDLHHHSQHFFQNVDESVIVSVKPNGNNNIHVEGMVSDELFLLPPGDSIRHKRSVEVASHTLWRQTTPVMVLDEIMGLPLPSPQETEESLNRVKRHALNAVPYIDVEVCVLLDYALYLKAGKNLRDLAAYMLHFWHAVNLRFATIQDMRINIKLKTVGVFQDEESQLFLKNNMLQGNKRIFEARHALSDLQRWLSYHYRDFKKFDVVFLLTGDDGCVFSGQACEKRVTGVSYVGGACRRHWLMGALNVAIGETDLVFRGVFTAAHEVGHLLGAPHDGESGAEMCTTNSGYLMSYNRSDPIKAHRFSTCSIKKFKEFLRTTAAHCLWNRAVEPIPYPKVLPGQQMKLKDQCYNYVKGEPCEVSEFQCHHLCCYDEKRKYIFTREQPAVHGTDCGRNAICYHGKCLLRDQLSGRV
ncbi:uncharacterized protein LOC115218591, partial [Argonauta hians]